MLVDAGSDGLYKKTAATRPFETYFDQIDMEAKAYWLGFILADGCVLWNQRTGTYALQVVLQVRDVEHLATLECDLGGTRVPQTVTSSLPERHEYKAVKLVWYSKHLVNRLMDLGIHPRKSGSETLPDVPVSQLRHFWRGVFDGDGCLATQVKGTSLVPEYRFSLAGSPEILNAFQTWAQKAAGIRSQKVIKARNSHGEAKISVFYMNGNRQIAALMNALYHDCTRKLRRKYDLYVALREQNTQVRPSYKRVYSS